MLGLKLQCPSISQTTIYSILHQILNVSPHTVRLAMQSWNETHSLRVVDTKATHAREQTPPVLEEHCLFIQIKVNELLKNGQNRGEG